MQIFTNERTAVRFQSNSRPLKKSSPQKAPKSPRRQNAFRSYSSGSASTHDEPCAKKNPSDLDRTSLGTFRLAKLIGQNHKKNLAPGLPRKEPGTLVLRLQLKTSFPLILSFSFSFPVIAKLWLQRVLCTLSVVSLTIKCAQWTTKWMKSSEQLIVETREQSKWGV